MSFIDTNLGGTKKEFPQTVWDLILKARDPSADVRRAGLEELCRQYWKPVYHYVRVTCVKSNEEAKDLAQGFFMHLVESAELQRYEPERASFRTYLKMVLKHFVRDEDKKAQALKRGGGCRILPLDGPEMTAMDLPAPTATSDPDRAFDHGWRVALLRDAVERVRTRYLSDGLLIKFRVFEEFDLLPEGPRPTYAELATRIGIKASDVQNYLVLLRREVLSEVRAHLGRMTASSDELRDEWQALFGS